MKEAATGQPQRMAELGNQWWFAIDTYVVLVEFFFLFTREEYAHLMFTFFFGMTQLNLQGVMFSWLVVQPILLFQSSRLVGQTPINPCCRFVSRQHRQI